MAMAVYRVLETLDLAAGTRLRLADGQARDRRHALEALGDGAYRARVPLQFKAGEVVGFDGAPDKAAAARLLDLSAPAAPAEGGDPAEGAPARPRATGAGRRPAAAHDRNA
jgi:hypothetical protein